jgi:hypothetical protein
MLDHILQTAQAYERKHGTPPDVVYINPAHFEALFRHYPELFNPGQTVQLGFRLLIIPGSLLTHPQAAVITPGRPYSRVA